VASEEQVIIKNMCVTCENRFVAVVVHVHITKATECGVRTLRDKTGASHERKCALLQICHSLLLWPVFRC
jgi:hypothetical protein